MNSRKVSVGLSKNLALALILLGFSTARIMNAVLAGLWSTPHPRRLSFMPSELPGRSTNVLMEKIKMANYSFEVVLIDATEVTVEMADKLFEAGGDDCLASSRDGIVIIAFDREASSMEEAIRSALQTIHQAGYAAKSVIFEPASFQV